ncbi:MAG TPA: glycogen debranching N-terminal domain-containing protein [Jiangellaceae bacterium]|nr:glycogen debranching N-terminal domain-containing protein [Jiangellaceae bacterium]
MTPHDLPLTLVHGGTFAMSDHSGDIDPAGYQGVYHRDIRVISASALTLDGTSPHVLAVDREGAAAAHWVYILAADEHDSPTAVLSRHRSVGSTVRERFVARVYAGRLAGATVRLAVATDFANLLELRAGHTPPDPAPLLPSGSATLTARTTDLGVEIEATGDGVKVVDGVIEWRLDLQAGQPSTIDVEIRPSAIRDQPADGFDPASPAPPDTLVVQSGSDRWTRSVASSLADLHGLRVEVPSMGLRYLGAGAPWFMALFGRDTLLTAWESLLSGPQLGLEVLQALASRQGTRTDPATGEEPGKILHEMRTGLASAFNVEPGVAYYGTADATPLFVMLLGELHRWGAADDDVRALLPAARAALRWCAEYGDVDGDGFVEYVSDEHGLANQGWKDSGDSMVHGDGSLARGPIALAEVQGYVFAAYQALAQLEERLGDAAAAAGLRTRAADLQQAFVDAFWLPDQGVVAMALDGDNAPLAVSASNVGHCLWTGILDGPVAEAAAHRLTRPDIATTWGLRTLAASEVAYNPLGYHLGSIWPHDTAIGVAGLVRHGHVDAAQRLVDGLLAAAGAFDWRLPELLGGMAGDEIAQPVPYPVACSPQAWSAAAPLLLLRSMLRLEPDVPAGVVTVAPILPDHEELLVTGVPLGSGMLGLRVRGRDVEVLEAPAGLEVHAGTAPGH